LPGSRNPATQKRADAFVLNAPSSRRAAAIAAPPPRARYNGLKRSGAQGRDMSLRKLVARPHHRTLREVSMGFRRIGIMSPGDMGQAIGAQLKAAGYDVCTALDARSDRSRALARDAGLEDLGSIARLVA
jgi:hypothetical protein